MRSLSATISRFGLLLIVGLLLPGVAAAQSTPVATSGEPVPLRLAVSSWVGYGPLWLAEERGFFDEEGVAVDLTLVEVSADRITAMQADRLDASATTVDTWTLFAAQGADLVQVLAVDESAGGDGIVAKREIASIADLAGKTRGGVVARRRNPARHVVGRCRGGLRRRPGRRSRDLATVAGQCPRDRLRSSAARYHGDTRTDRRHGRLPTAVHRRESGSGRRIRPRLLPRGRGDRDEPGRGKRDHGREHWYGDGGLRRHAG
ncbi:MAG: aliphatic sulfonates family transporter, periplasmic ligand-binding protein [Thermomicrobiales bacterium]|nr:aliphatic sulfonates family transporter, periplasmic ligand-binding protein [Thermomicrobiales bacterium]